MLKVTRGVKLKLATSSERGNVQTFLERLLVEVVAANYRHFLHEHLHSSSYGDENAEYWCWPPLMTNEKRVTGLFAGALSVVCPVTTPEVYVARPEDDKKRSGRGWVDFMTIFGSRHIGLEVKCIAMATFSKDKWGGVAKRWGALVDQSASVMTAMRDKEESLYEMPVSVGLLVIRVLPQVPRGDTPDTVREGLLEQMKTTAVEMQRYLKPDFFAFYTPPPEMQTFLRGRKHGNVHLFNPGVMFAAVVHGKQRPKSAPPRARKAS